MIKADYWSLKNYQAQYEWERDNIPLGSKVIYDIGCNKGYGCKWLSDFDKLVVGVDIDSGIIESNISRKDPFVCYTACDVTRYRMLTGKDIEISNRKEYFKVFLPLVSTDPKCKGN
jgi:SAM-dependent methyltransferase